MAWERLSGTVGSPVATRAWPGCAGQDPQLRINRKSFYKPAWRWAGFGFRLPALSSSLEVPRVGKGPLRGWCWMRRDLGTSQPVIPIPRLGSLHLLAVFTRGERGKKRGIGAINKSRFRAVTALAVLDINQERGEGMRPQDLTGTAREQAEPFGDSQHPLVGSPPLEHPKKPPGIPKTWHAAEDEGALPRHPPVSRDPLQSSPRAAHTERGRSLWHRELFQREGMALELSTLQKSGPRRAPGAGSLLSPLPLLPGMVSGAGDQIRAPRECSGMKEPPKNLGWSQG